MAHLWHPGEGGALAYTVLSTGLGGAQNLAGCRPNAGLTLEIRMAQRAHQPQRAALSFRKAREGRERGSGEAPSLIPGRNLQTNTWPLPLLNTPLQRGSASFGGCLVVASSLSQDPLGILAAASH